MKFYLKTLFSICLFSLYCCVHLWDPVTNHFFHLINKSSNTVNLYYETIDSTSTRTFKLNEEVSIYMYSEAGNQNELTQEEAQNIIFKVTATIGDSLYYGQNPIQLSKSDIQQWSSGTGSDGITTWYYSWILYDSMFVKIR